MYFLIYIIKERYMILAILLQIQYYFINKYIDWDQFNIFYNKNFKIKEKRIVDKTTHQFK